MDDGITPQIESTKSEEVSQVVSADQPSGEIKSAQQIGLDKSEEEVQQQLVGTLQAIADKKEGLPERTAENVAQKPPLCKGTKKNGASCTLLALSDGYCFAHSPALAEKRKVANKMGGTHSSKTERIKKLMPSRYAPVTEMLENVLQGLSAKTIDAQTALAIANVSKALVNVINAGELEEKLRTLEKQKVKVEEKEFWGCR